MKNKVYCEECAYHCEADWYDLEENRHKCSNERVYTVSEYVTDETFLTPKKTKVVTGHECARINKDNNCKGFLQLKETDEPIKLFGLRIGTITRTNKVDMEDI